MSFAFGDGSIVRHPEGSGEVSRRTHSCMDEPLADIIRADITLALAAERAPDGEDVSLGTTDVGRRTFTCRCQSPRPRESRMVGFTDESRRRTLHSLGPLPSVTKAAVSCRLVAPLEGMRRRAQDLFAPV